MEESLDKIEEGDSPWVETVEKFYRRFAKDLKTAGVKMENLKRGTETGQACPQCGSSLLEKWGRFGKFLACSGYPECKFTQDLNGNGRGRPEEIPANETCEACGKPMLIKEGRYGKFIACSGYPQCKTTKPLTMGIGCPRDGCGGELVERRSKRGKAYYACSRYPDCKFILWHRPVPTPCPKCGSPFLTERTVRGRKLIRTCISEKCDYKQEVEATVQ
jgi:DNA topoisomerase-1